DRPTSGPSPHNGIFGLGMLHKLHLQTDILIPRDAWLKRVLPHVGYGVAHVLELPAVPLEACQSFHQAFAALKQAEEKHRMGFYDDAVGKCRLALEKFFDRIPADP